MPSKKQGGCGKKRNGKGKMKNNAKTNKVLDMSPPAYSLSAKDEEV